MKRSQVLVWATVAGLVICGAEVKGQAGGAGDEKAFLEKHVSDVVKVTPKRVTNGAVTKAFGVPVYQIEVAIEQGDGAATEKQMAAAVDGKLVPIAKPGTDADCPWLVKMMAPGFVLKADADAKVLQEALDVLMPPFSDDDKKVVAFKHNGKEWVFIRGTFFDKNEGFVVTTNDAGKVVGAKFTLKLP